MLFSKDVGILSISTLTAFVEFVVTTNVAAVQGLISTFVTRSRDNYYYFCNLILPYRPKGRVIPPGKPGHAGVWPQYYPPTETDSRSPCPGLNALANHGIIPRDGKRLSYDLLRDAIVNTYNLAPTTAESIVDSFFWFANGRDWVNLSDLCTHNVIEHDSSFTRPDTAFWPDQSKPCARLIDVVLARASNGKHLSLADFSYNGGVRRVECSKTNTQYQMTAISKFFDGGNVTSAFRVFGGVVADLEIFLKEERLPEGWEPKCRFQKGLTLLHIEHDSFVYNFNINYKQRLRAGDAFIVDQATTTVGQKRVSVK